MAHRYDFWAPPVEHRSIRLVDDFYRGRMTPAGHVFFWAFWIFAVQIRGPTGIMLGTAITAGALATAYLVGFFFRPNVEVIRHMSGAPTVADVLRYRVTVKNVGRFTARQLMVEERSLPADLRPVEPPPIIQRLAPGESETVTLALQCKWRGAYVLPTLQVSSIYPATLLKLYRRKKMPQTVLVYPRVEEVDRLSIPLGRHYQPGGMAFASRVGDSSEFLGTRDWRRGDRLRDLHWPSFARTGRPISKEFQEEYFVRVAMVLDTEVGYWAKEERLFERGLGFAAGVADSLARQEAIVDLLAVGTELHRFQVGRALGQVENVLEVMACLRIAWDFDAEALSAALIPDLRRLSAVFLMLTRWDRRRAALIESIRSRGVAVRVLFLQEPKDLDGLTPEEWLVLS